MFKMKDKKKYHLVVLCHHTDNKADSKSTVLFQEEGLGWFLCDS